MMQSASRLRIEARTAKPPSAQKSCNSLHYRDISWIPRFQVSCSMKMKSQANSASQSCSVVSRICGSFASYSMGFHDIPWDSSSWIWSSGQFQTSAVRETILRISKLSFNEIRPDLSLSCHGLVHGSNIKYMIYLTIKWWTMDDHDSGMIVLDHYISFLWMNFG